MKIMDDIDKMVELLNHLSENIEDAEDTLVNDYARCVAVHNKILDAKKIIKNIEV